MKRLAVIVGVGLTAAPAGAQCQQWQAPRVLPPPNDVVFAVTSWDPDGPGPEVPLLVIGGRFTLAGGVIGPSIAAWDGGGWRPLGAGFDGWVSTLTKFRGDLIAGGGFSHSGPREVRCVARWDGAAWHPLGIGMETLVHELAVIGEDLYAAGWFTYAGFALARNAARWDGQAWHALGVGLNGEAKAVTGHGGMAVFGGAFTAAGGAPARSVAAWDGTAWRALGEGVDFPVHSLASYGGQLYAGGNGPGPQVSIARLSRWDGSAWSTVHPEPSGGGGAAVEAMLEHGGRLIVAGAFLGAGPSAMNNIGAWDGASWRALTPGLNGAVMAVGVHGDSLFAGGAFNHSGVRPAPYLARWGCSDCYADCDQSTGPDSLDVFDFLCYQNAYAVGEPWACNCDPSSGPNVCDVMDFLCFQNAFARGCR